jgi:hypothetical protein
MRREGARVALIRLGLCGILLTGCTAAEDGFGTGTSPSAPATSPEPSALPTTAGQDAADALAGRAIEALADGEDAILRVSEPGWRLPGEAILDVFDDRVLSGVAGEGDGGARLIVRDLAGNVIREIDVGFNLPQAGIVRHDAVFFAGVQVDPGADPLEVEDRGVWSARGDEAPRRIREPEGALRYADVHVSPNGATLGVSLCSDACKTVIVREDEEPLEIPQPGLTALTDATAVVLTSWSGIAGHDLADGSRRWTIESQGVVWSTHAMADGRRIVHTSLGDDGDGDGDTIDEYRIEVVDSMTGAVTLRVPVPLAAERWSLSSTLSTDRYAVLVPSVLPDAAEAPIPLRVIDLSDGSTLDVELALAGLADGD